MSEQPINHIYIHGWFDYHAQAHAQDIERFLRLAEEGVFVLEFEMEGVKVYRYTGVNAGTRVHWFNINAHGDATLITKMGS
ncbi:hypothetical protein LZG74_16835 [Dyadobacter sp. CY327]|uniref:hypothetical protein n=1 Tax=Dyadobacter sp. CY327 TaxID=2907301 RepID=UPI001F446BEB|nr:hypothetical protein [Dyadobacter sp. CY327]MCE7071984.1 hypothetical protein [Dyadobacter sp. CY327]